MWAETRELCSAIRNAGYLVRHYARGGRTGVGKLKRDQAILALGATVRHAFSVSDDYESLLAAVADAIRPKEDQPF